jgi:hypothetical protein
VVGMNINDDSLLFCKISAVALPNVLFFCLLKALLYWAMSWSNPFQPLIWVYCFVYFISSVMFTIAAKQRFLFSELVDSNPVETKESLFHIGYLLFHVISLYFYVNLIGIYDYIIITLVVVLAEIVVTNYNLSFKDRRKNPLKIYFQLCICVFTLSLLGILALWVVLRWAGEEERNEGK